MTDETELRMYLVVRGDIEMPLGKALGQAGHGFCTALIQLMVPDGPFIPDQELVARYYKDNQPKIVVKCKNLAALLRAEQECKDANINYFLVTDAGRTHFPEPTVTCMAIGPCHRSQLPKFIERMQLL